MRWQNQADVVIIGAGLSGLTAATYLSRARKSVMVIEKSSSPGGRARTVTHNQLLFNLGPHALYRAGAAVGIFRELGIHFLGKIPEYEQARFVKKDRLYAFPLDPFRLLMRSELLGWRARLQALRFFAMLPKMNVNRLEGRTVNHWLAAQQYHPDLEALIRSLIRVWTYGNDPAFQDAGAALKQGQIAQKGGVYYLDGGWQTIVDSLAQAANTAGATIIKGARVKRILYSESVAGVELENGNPIRASNIILTGNPGVAARLAPNVRSLSSYAEKAIPVRAACLNIGVRQLLRPDRWFALGIDEPLYFSAHSAWAKLGQGAVIHVARYLSHSDRVDQNYREQLEALSDLMQPGWRKEIRHTEYLPSMIVSNALSTTEKKPDCGVPEVAGLYIAGDWVGNEGLLADSAVHSARAAARRILTERTMGQFSQMAS